MPLKNNETVQHQIIDFDQLSASRNSVSFSENELYQNQYDDAQSDQIQRQNYINSPNNNNNNIIIDQSQPEVQHRLAVNLEDDNYQTLSLLNNVKGTLLNIPQSESLQQNKSKKTISEQSEESPEHSQMGLISERKELSCSDNSSINDGPMLEEGDNEEEDNIDYGGKYSGKSTNSTANLYLPKKTSKQVFKKQIIKNKNNKSSNKNKKKSSNKNNKQLVTIELDKDMQSIQAQSYSQSNSQITNLSKMSNSNMHLNISLLPVQQNKTDKERKKNLIKTLKDSSVLHNKGNKKKLGYLKHTNYHTETDTLAGVSNKHFITDRLELSASQEMNEQRNQNLKTNKKVKKQNNKEELKKQNKQNKKITDNKDRKSKINKQKARKMVFENQNLLKAKLTKSSTLCYTQAGQVVPDPTVLRKKTSAKGAALPKIRFMDRNILFMNVWNYIKSDEVPFTNKIFLCFIIAMLIITVLLQILQMMDYVDNKSKCQIMEDEKQSQLELQSYSNTSQLLLKQIDAIPDTLMYFNFGLMLLLMVVVQNFANMEVFCQAPFRSKLQFSASILAYSVFPFFQFPMLIYDFKNCNFRGVLISDMNQAINIAKAIGYFVVVIFLMSILQCVFLNTCKISHRISKSIKRILFWLMIVIFILLALTAKVIVLAQINISLNDRSLLLPPAFFILEFSSWFYITTSMYCLYQRQIRRHRVFKPVMFKKILIGRNHTHSKKDKPSIDYGSTISQSQDSQDLDKAAKLKTMNNKKIFVKRNISEKTNKPVIEMQKTSVLSEQKLSTNSEINIHSQQIISNNQQQALEQFTDTISSQNQKNEINE